MWQNLESCVIPLPSVIPILEGLGTLSQLAKELGTDIETCTREVLPKKL